MTPLVRQGPGPVRLRHVLTFSFNSVLAFALFVGQPLSMAVLETSFMFRVPRALLKGLLNLSKDPSH